MFGESPQIIINRARRDYEFVPGKKPSSSNLDHAIELFDITWWFDKEHRGCDGFAGVKAPVWHFDSIIMLLIGSIMTKYHPKGTEENIDVQPDGPVTDIVHIEASALLKGCAVTSRYLP